MSFFRFELARLLEKGYADFNPVKADLVVTFRGTGLIDVFDAGTWHHVAFLDFDLQREIHLDSAFGSPLIGLPFPAALKQEKGVSLKRFEDLRQRHHYGFFVETGYRNKGAKGIWNLDELMMAIALEYAEAKHLAWFHIRPTGDTAAYYRRKYSAVRRPTTGPDTISSIRLGPNRNALPHVKFVQRPGCNRNFSIESEPDPGW